MKLIFLFIKIKSNSSSDTFKPEIEGVYSIQSWINGADAEKELEKYSCI